MLLLFWFFSLSACISMQDKGREIRTRRYGIRSRNSATIKHRSPGRWSGKAVIINPSENLPFHFNVFILLCFTNYLLRLLLLCRILQSLMLLSLGMIKELKVPWRVLSTTVHGWETKAWAQWEATVCADLNINSLWPIFKIYHLASIISMVSSLVTARTPRIFSRMQPI